ncbi:MAG: HsdR family type I site-specific deoxyribonuclease [Bacteroidales bacterium]|nr:HsdR family type I site-specific deoxyribonuclease [Bacteroidales bacterium]
MSFNEINAVENFVIHTMTGVNLNETGTLHEPMPSYGAQWIYTPASELPREITEVLIETELKQALIKLNPEIAALPDRADEVIYKLRSILLSVNSTGLVRANEEFAEWLKGNKTMPFGKNYAHVSIKLIDFDVIENNKFQLVNQFSIRNRETKRPDIVMFVNGIPLVVGEAKTPVRPSVSWLDAASDIHDGYENSVPELFVPNVLSFATEGKELYYGAVRTPLEFWAAWRVNEGDDMSRLMGLNNVAAEMKQLLSPKTLLDILYNFTTYSTNKKRQRIKVVCRYQQYEGANLIVQRVLENKIKRGLIWHFQGSGKSLLMLFAAQKMRKMKELKSPTVMIVVDRVDLDSQTQNVFKEAPNVMPTEDIDTLNKYLANDSRYIIITTIFKFKDAQANINQRENIIVMVDEAHRTQEGDLGQRMRLALPNAFFFGLTGTPINKTDHNTFWTFGAQEDENGYMSRYSFEDALRDKTILPLHFEPRLLDIHIDREKVDEEFAAISNTLDEDAKITLSNKAAKMLEFLKSPERIEIVCKDIAQHYQEKVEPQGFKAMIVTPDREACHLYKQELSKYFPDSASAVVISTSGKGEDELKRLYNLSKDEQEKLIEKFNKPDSELKFLIVTAKLLTGFDAPILQTMYLDKSLKDHTLLQAICRTNRKFPNKTFGRIVDYFGVFDDAAKALEFDEEVMKKVITNLSSQLEELPRIMANNLAHFEGVDRTIEGFDGLQTAQDAIDTNEKRDAFASDYRQLANIWESLSPDPALEPYRTDYKWLSNVYQSVKPSGPDSLGKLLWLSLGAQTKKIMYDNIHVGGIHTDMQEVVLDETMVASLMASKDPKAAKKIEKELIKRFKKYTNQPKFVELSKRLEALRDKAEQGLISSIEFIKELCQIARETIQAEKQEEHIEVRKTGTEALTELFLELRTEDTPAVVGRIVADIDSIVKIVRFPGWQTTNAGEREVQKALRKTLLKYKLHKEEVLFNKAYMYIREYY